MDRREKRRLRGPLYGQSARTAACAGSRTGPPQRRRDCRNGNARVASGQAGHLDHSDRHGVCRDPLGSGLVASLARPGGDITGMSLMAPDLGGKRLELLKELLPR